MPSLSDVCGWISILTWLGAQFPQVLENIRNQSVEGLALPFLLNWLLGDLTNLIGCLLTHQLPFQTYLAGYFCFVDVTLMSQFFYYSRKASLKGKGVSTTPSLPSRHSTAHYRALSNAAANVAASAALAARPDSERGEEEDEVDEDALAALAESFHSELGHSHSRLGRRGVSWSRERPLSPTLEPLNPITLSRGRSALPYAEEEDEAEREESQRRRSSRASKVSASMVFMSAWALVSVGALVGGGRAVQRDSGIRLSRGRVLADVKPVPLAEAHLVPIHPLVPVDAPPPETSAEVLVSFESPPLDGEFSEQMGDGSSMERIIGRIFAWACTTLYLTSRLPQIWKNYVRKSVEGLSVYLFIFAFLGNFFYVISILTSSNMSLPPPEAAAYLKESIPYLLGSGGTLMFDVTIVCQTMLYRPKSVLHARRSSLIGAGAEEREALMSASADVDVATPRRRVVGADGA
ncbi:PQ-loop-domain-containing protein [Peniophora sp. CONT]|nr:PQ-loop-domain-containing protein [Peniophora sp. CONT]